jgi:hypothetical protein
MASQIFEASIWKPGNKKISVETAEARFSPEQFQEIRPASPGKAVIAPAEGRI